jgi:hypothetical protein
MAHQLRPRQSAWCIIHSRSRQIARLLLARSALRRRADPGQSRGDENGNHDHRGGQHRVAEAKPIDQQHQQRRNHDAA